MPNRRLTASETRERRLRAVTLRDELHWSYEAIAAELGLAGPSGAAQAASAGRRIAQGLPPRQTGNRRARRAGGRNRRGMPEGTGRCFGVEIEFNGIDRGTAARALVAAGIDCRDEGYNHHVRTYWKVVHDATVWGGEAVSPILRGEDGLREMATVMGALRRAGATVSSNCGLHVHHDMTENMTGEQIARFVEFYVNRNDTIDRLVARSRRNRGIGGDHVEPLELARVAQQLRDRGTVSEYAMSRYRSINPTSYPKYGTVEIRQHQGTLNVTKAQAWVRFGWAIVDAVQRGTDQDIAHGTAMLGDLTDHANLPQRTAAYLTSRMEAFSR